MSSLEGIDIQQLNAFIQDSLKEDIGPGDYTSEACIPEEDLSVAELLVKDHGVISGVVLAEYIFRFIEPDVIFEQLIEDGQDVDRGDIAFRVKCNTRTLLKVERLVLNIMQRMSGISTLASRFAVEVDGLPVKILDTRKTTPLLRFLEKWAVKIGGCYNYRDGLYDRIMLKDNHIEACGSVPAAIQAVNNFLKNKGLDLPITIEVRNFQELNEVLTTGGVDRIMLDNFDAGLMREAVAIIGKRYEVEASGGITLNVVRAIAKTGVDYISVGALTHSAGSLDLSLKIIG